jgi:hypothetical protein
MMMAEESIWPENKRKRVKPQMTAKRGAPKNIKRMMAMMGRRVKFSLLETPFYLSSGS